MSVERKTFVVFVDQDPSSSRALKKCLKEITKKDDLYLINLYSSWDYLNDEKNEGKLSLHQLCEYSEQFGFKPEIRQVETSSFYNAILSELKELGAGTFYIGKQTFSRSTDEPNPIFNFFASIKSALWGDVVSQLLKTPPQGSQMIICE